LAHKPEPVQPSSHRSIAHFINRSQSLNAENLKSLLPTQKPSDSSRMSSQASLADISKVTSSAVSIKLRGKIKNISPFMLRFTRRVKACGLFEAFDILVPSQVEAQLVNDDAPEPGIMNVLETSRDRNKILASKPENFETHLPAWGNNEKKKDCLAKALITACVSDEHVEKTNHEVDHAIFMISKLQEHFCPTDKISTQMLRKKMDQLDIRTFESLESMLEFVKNTIATLKAKGEICSAASCALTMSKALNPPERFRDLRKELTQKEFKTIDEVNSHLEASMKRCVV